MLQKEHKVQEIDLVREFASMEKSINFLIEVQKDRKWLTAPPYAIVEEHLIMCSDEELSCLLNENVVLNGNLADDMEKGTVLENL